MNFTHLPSDWTRVLTKQLGRSYHSKEIWKKRSEYSCGNPLPLLRLDSSGSDKEGGAKRSIDPCYNLQWGEGFQSNRDWLVVQSAKIPHLSTTLQHSITPIRNYTMDCLSVQSLYSEESRFPPSIKGQTFLTQLHPVKILKLDSIHRECCVARPSILSLKWV